TTPAACEGDTAEIIFPDVTLKDVAEVLPNITAVTFVNPLPAIWTVVHPCVEACLGETPVTVAVRTWRNSRTSAAMVRVPTGRRAGLRLNSGLRRRINRENLSRASNIASQFARIIADSWNGC